MQLPVHLERFVQVYPRSFFTDTKATMVVDYTVDGKNNKEDKTTLINLWVAGLQLPVHFSTVSFGPRAALALRCTTSARLIVFVSQSVIIAFFVLFFVFCFCVS